MLDAVVVKVLDSVIKEVVLTEGRGLGPGGVLLKGGRSPPPPGNLPPTAVVIAEKDIHTQSSSDPTSSLSSLPAETRIVFGVSCGEILNECVSGTEKNAKNQMLFKQISSH